MDDVICGKKLREMRMSAGKTVQEVSEYLKSVGHKAATQTIYGWERGHSQPTIDAFLEMCIYYGVTDVLSCFGSSESQAKKSPSTAEAAPGEEQVSVERATSLLVSLGFIEDGQILSDNDFLFLSNVMGILEAWFKKGR